ncbi:putative N6-adenine methyltransferase-domain-containing protein [Mrakia frigida]|uniref:protein-lysine N-methyltransferase n=1 Tax=Mrakia frigida TaxID=29902 RepID=UPI003FCC12E4
MSAPGSPSSSRSFSPPLELDPATLAILGSFMADKAEEERRFQELAEKAQAVFDEVGEQEEEKMMSVDEFRRVVSEDFGMSQFWYSTPFAYSLAKSIRSLCPTPQTRVAFLCSPTGYVAFQSLNPLPRTLLFEYDARFDVLPVVGRDRRISTGPSKEEGGFVKYDLHEPEKWDKQLEGTVDIAVVDVPYLNEKTNALVAQTLSTLLSPSAKLLVLTSTSVPFEVLSRVYTLPQLGSLKRCEHAKVEHEGGRIQNAFGMWGTWDGAENFMRVG